MDLKNIKVEDLKELALKYSDKKTLIKVGISVAAVIIFLIIYYAILSTMVDKRKAKLVRDKPGPKPKAFSEFLARLLPTLLNNKTPTTTIPRTV